MPLSNLGPKVAVPLIFVRLCGYGAGALLSELLYWFTPTKAGKLRASIYRDERFWTMIDPGIASEKLGLSRQEFRSAIERLKDLGVVEQAVYKFNGAPKTHLSLDREKLGKLVSDWLESTNGLVESNQSTGCNQPNLIYLSIDKTMEPIAMKPMAMHTAKNAVVQKLQAVQSKTPVTLEGLWKNRVSLAGHFVPELTMKERAQLKALAKKVDDPAAVIDWAVMNWTKFGTLAAASSAQKVPDRPNLGFLLMHCAVAVEVLQSIAKSSAPKSVVNKPVPAAPEPATIEKKPNPLADLQEFE